MANRFGGGTEFLLRRRFLLMRKDKVDDNMFELIDTVNTVNNYGNIQISFTAEDNSFYLLIPRENYENIMIAVNIINAKYAFMAMSNKTGAGAVCETNYGLSNNTVNIRKSIAKNEYKSILFDIYKMRK